MCLERLWKMFGTSMRKDCLLVKSGVLWLSYQRFCVLDSNVPKLRSKSDPGFLADPQNGIYRVDGRLGQDPQGIGLSEQSNSVENELQRVVISRSTHVLNWEFYLLELNTEAWIPFIFFFPFS